MSPSYAERSWAMSLKVSRVERILCVPPCRSLAMLAMSSTGTKSWFFIPIFDTSGGGEDMRRGVPMI